MLKAEKLKASVDQRQRLNQTTLDWQERLFEPKTSIDLCKQAAHHLQAKHYDEVVIERADALGLCGYPPCYQRITVPTSRSTGIGVTDGNVQEKRKFCSLHCWKASRLYHKQLSDEDVFLRKPLQNEVLCLPAKPFATKEAVDTCLQQLAERQQTSAHRNKIQAFTQLAPLREKEKQMGQQLEVKERPLSETFRVKENEHANSLEAQQTLSTEMQRLSFREKEDNGNELIVEHQVVLQEGHQEDRSCFLSESDDDSLDFALQQGPKQKEDFMFGHLSLMNRVLVALDGMLTPKARSFIRGDALHEAFATDVNHEGEEEDDRNSEEDEQEEYGLEDVRRKIHLSKTAHRKEILFQQILNACKELSAKLRLVKTPMYAMANVLAELLDYCRLSVSLQAILASGITHQSARMLLMLVLFSIMRFQIPQLDEELKERHELIQRLLKQLGMDVEQFELLVDHVQK